MLKGMVDTVSDKILKVKIDGIVTYFNSVNDFDFVRFEDMNLKIIKSISDKKLKDDVDEYLTDIKQSLATIETLENKDRILAKFQMSKNLSDAISQTNIEIQREEQIKAQNEEPEKTFKLSLTVYGTKEQFAMLKQFMNENNIKYEGVAR